MTPTKQTNTHMLRSIEFLGGRVIVSQAREEPDDIIWQQPVISCDSLRRAERVGAEQVRDALTEAIIICERWEDEA
jgi:hypothetical protein